MRLSKALLAWLMLPALGLLATIRTASGTIPAYVNPPTEPAQTATGGLASAE